MIAGRLFITGHNINALNDLPFRVNGNGMSNLFSNKFLQKSMEHCFHTLQYDQNETVDVRVDDDTQIKREFIDFIYRSIISTQILLICKHVFHIRQNFIIKHILKKECSRSLFTQLNNLHN